MNHMKKVHCPVRNTEAWANSCKEKHATGGVVYEYRCTLCGGIHEKKG